MEMTGDTEYIRKQAENIRDVMQRIIDACQNGTTIDPYAKNKVMGGSLAQDAAVLAIELIKYESEAK